MVEPQQVSWQEPVAGICKLIPIAAGLTNTPGFIGEARFEEGSAGSASFFAGQRQNVVGFLRLFHALGQSFARRGFGFGQAVLVAQHLGQIQ